MYRFLIRTLCALVMAAVLLANSLAAAADPLLPKPVSGNVEASVSLAELFPKDGPLVRHTAGQVAWSHDGQYGSYLQRGELWILNAKTRTQFAAVSRANLADLHHADEGVSKFEGVPAYVWSPKQNELLFLHYGNLFRYDPAKKEIAQLFRTKTHARRLQYLTDGSGFVLDDANPPLDVWKGTLSAKKLAHWQPKVPEGEKLLQYSISPDGKHIALTTTRGKNPMVAENKVAVTNFGDRFLKLTYRERSPLAGDAMPDYAVSVFVAPLETVTTEAGDMGRAYTYKFTARADVVSPLDWSPDSRKLAFARYAQHRRELEILQVEIEQGDGTAKPKAQPARSVLSLKHTGGPDTPPMVQPKYLAGGRQIVFICEQSGYRQLHRLDVASGTFTALTEGRFETYPLALSSDRSTMDVATTKEHATRTHLYRVSMADGKMQRLTARHGVYGDLGNDRVFNAAVSPDGKHVLAAYETFGTLRELVHIDVAAGTQETLTSSHSDRARRLATARPEFFTYENRHGDTIHGYLFKPKGWKASDKRPALIYVYGGPTAIDSPAKDGNVTDHCLFAHYMAQHHGYVTAVIDPRGSSGYSARFESANFNQPGKPQVEDLEDGAKFLVRHHGVDGKRIGLHGWSFGGFVTQRCLYTSDTFAAGIAGAGPTEWENYNDWYTSNVIGPTDKLKDFSLVPLAKNLKGQLLLVHGMQDENVLLEDTIHVYGELQRAGKSKQVELFLDPKGRHSLGGDVCRADKYAKYEQFLLRTLGSGR